jgi:hypothetical protein
MQSLQNNNQGGLQMLKKNCVLPTIFLAFILIFLIGGWVYSSGISLEAVEKLTNIKFPTGSHISNFKRIDAGIDSAFIAEVSILNQDDEDQLCDTNSFSRGTTPKLSSDITDYLSERKYRAAIVCYRQSYDTTEFWYSVVLDKKLILYYSTL